MITKTKKNNAADITTADLKQRIQHHLKNTLGDRLISQTTNENTQQNKQAYWQATSLALNEIIVDKLQETKVNQAKSKSKSINYLSLEYLMGRLLSNNLHNLDLYKSTEKALKSLGFDLADLCEEGADLALGNGGLGRLAACFLDSLATLDYNAMGYGIHYQHGLFKQSFKDGHQIEQPDMWREFGSPWEICRPESTQLIPVYGYVEQQAQADGSLTSVWRAGKMLKGVPWDITQLQ